MKVRVLFMFLVLWAGGCAGLRAARLHVMADSEPMPPGARRVDVQVVPWLYLQEPHYRVTLQSDEAPQGILGWYRERFFAHGFAESIGESSSESEAKESQVYEFAKENSFYHERFKLSFPSMDAVSKDAGGTRYTLSYYTHSIVDVPGDVVNGFVGSLGKIPADTPWAWLLFPY